MSPPSSPRRRGRRRKRRRCTWRISRPTRRGRRGSSPSSAFGSGVPTGCSRRWDLSPGFYAKFAKAVARAGEAERARALFEEAILPLPSLRRSISRWSSTTPSSSGSRGRPRRRPRSSRSISRTPRRRSGRRRASSRRGSSGRRGGSRRRARSSSRSRRGMRAPGTAERARYLAAWIAEDEGDLAGATESFERLRWRPDDTIRQEALFRFAYGLYRTEAVRRGDRGVRGRGSGAAAGRWSAPGTGTGRRGRFATAGRGAEAAPIFADLAGDAFAGIYALFAVSERGGEPFRILNASSSGETKACGEERDQLWDAVRKANWGAGGRGEGAAGGAADPPRGGRTTRCSRRSGSTARRRGRRSGWPTAGRRACSGTSRAT